MTPLPRASRLLTTVAAVLLLGVYVLPLWRIELEAPQYPEGIGMRIHVNTVEGAKENDLQNINGLNHYIGMKEIHPDAIPELRWMPWIVGALIVSGLGAAASNRRAALAAWVVGFVVVALAGLYDFWRWGYDYGHDLDPNAIIQVPGMAYQPPLIGSKQLLNFTAHSWPASGGILVGISLALGVVALFLAVRRRAVPAAIGAAALAAACAAGGPRAIAYGEESCAYCRMTITDPRFGAEVRTETGLVHTFDSIECVASFVNASDATRLQGIWVTDYERPGTLVPAGDATFWRAGGGVSPMGKGLVATAGARPPATLSSPGEPLRWGEVVALVAREGIGGAAEAAHAH